MSVKRELAKKPEGKNAKQENVRARHSCSNVHSNVHSYLLVLHPNPRFSRKRDCSQSNYGPKPQSQSVADLSPGKLPGVINVTQKCVGV